MTERYGLSAPAEPGWHVAITRREPAAARRVGPVGAVGVRSTTGEITYPVLHACTRPLPTARGDYGSGVVTMLRGEDVFLALVEFGPEVAGRGLFAAQGMPRLAPSQFDPRRMPRMLPGRSAAQHFFSSGGRAFCLYAVLGSHARRMATVPRAAALSRRIGIADRQALVGVGGRP